jgi:Ulp1 family protease
MLLTTLFCPPICLSLFRWLAWRIQAEKMGSDGLNIPVLKPENVVIQRNGYDCGFYMLRNIMHFVELQSFFAPSYFITHLNKIWSPVFTAHDVNKDREDLATEIRRKTQHVKEEVVIIK